MDDLVAVGPRGSGGKAEQDGRNINISEDVQLTPHPPYADDETGKRISCPSGQANHVEHVKRLVRVANTQANTTMEVSIPGTPGLVPHTLVRVEGVSKVFGGVYRVMKVIHKLDTGGYDCEVSLVRDASTGDAEVGRGQRPQTGGTDPGQADSGQGVDPVEEDE
jgi:hypothetical protein